MPLVFRKPKDFWMPLPMMMGSSATYTNLPAEDTFLWGTHIHSVSLKEATKIKAWTKVGPAGSAGSVARLQYTLDLVTWHTFEGMDISISSNASNGRDSAIISVPTLAKTMEFTSIRVVCAGGDGVSSPAISFYTPSILIQV